MAPLSEDKRLIVKVAKLYYFEGLTQAKIAKKIGVSRPIISKMLTKARADNIIEIFIKDESAHTVDLELQIENYYSIKEAIVVPSSDYNKQEKLNLLGQAAAVHVSKKIETIDSIGISWGNAVSSFVNAYSFQKNDNVNVVPLIGGMGRNHLDLHSNFLALKFAQKLNTSCSYLYAPAIIKNLDTKSRLIESEDISGVLEEGYSVDIAIVGIGNPFIDSTMENIGYLSKEDLETLRTSDAVGDINSVFFDKSGKTLKNHINDSVIGIDIEGLRSIEETIAIAQGNNKVESIHYALISGVVDVLITDNDTAEKILNLN